MSADAWESCPICNGLPEKLRGGKMNIELDDQYLCEVFEILCSIPYEKATMNDPEPPTLRHPGIEQMLNQISAVLNA